MSDEDLHPEGWPHPNERPCEDCSHIWFEGERRHEYIEHAAQRPEDVTVLCVLCRRQRGLPRAAPQ